MQRNGFGRIAVAGVAAAAIAGGSALALSQESGGGAGDRSGASATAVTKKKVHRGLRGRRGPRGLRGLAGPAGPIGATGATGATGDIGPSSATAVLDDSAFPFVGIPTTDTVVATAQLGPGAWVIQAKLGMNGTSATRVVCQLLAGATQLDTSILSSGTTAGSVGQGEMQMMSATTLAAATQVQVLCHREGGASDPFASQQQILALKVGSATTTRVTF